MPLVSLSTVLWRERRLVDLIETGRHGRDELQFAELDRAVLVHGLTRDYALRADASLRELADRVPEPWRAVLGSHRDALIGVESGALPRSLVDFLR